VVVEILHCLLQLLLKVAYAALLSSRMRDVVAESCMLLLRAAALLSRILCKQHSHAFCLFIVPVLSAFQDNTTHAVLCRCTSPMRRLMT
jgi:hypothetical protein